MPGDLATTARTEAARPSRPSTDAPGWFARILKTPLLTKLVLLDLVINVIAFLVMQWTPPEIAEQVTVLSLVVVLVLNAALVAWALRPLWVLEQTARRVSDGEYAARTHMPPLADRNLVRIGAALDTLLDRVAADRERVRSLASQVVAAGDQERAHIARELHDGTAQSLSAMEMLIASSLAEHPDGPLGERLVVMRDIVTEALSEVRALSHSVHPRVLDDLGLPAALEYLARRSRAHGDVAVDVSCEGSTPLPASVASVLYRVAQEAVHNAIKHGHPDEIRIMLDVGPHQASLQVSDDGIGFDPGAVDRSLHGMGLFVMQERVSLVDGTFEVDARPGAGTVVRARIPLRERA